MNRTTKEPKKVNHRKSGRWSRSRKSAARLRREGERSPRVEEAVASIDLHSTTSVLGVMDSSNGEMICRWRFPTTGAELVSHIKAVRAKRLELTIEQTPMTRWAAALLRPLCDRLVPCDPRENRAVAGNSFKSDEADVDILCRLLRLGELKEVHHEEDDSRFAFKAAVQHYRDIVRDKVRARNKVKAMMRRVGAHFESKKDRSLSPKHRAEVLEFMPTDTWRRSLSRCLRHHDWLVEETKAARKEYEGMGCAYAEIARFLEIPGVGSVTAHTFSAFISTPERFATKGRLFRYCALAITDRSSDGKQLGYQRVEKNAGCRDLKDVSYHAWLGAITGKDNEVKRWFQAALRTNGGNQKKARLSTQRKILHTMWAMWKNDRPYDPDLMIHPSDRLNADSG